MLNSRIPLLYNLYSTEQLTYHEAQRAKANDTKLNTLQPMEGQQPLDTWFSHNRGINNTTKTNAAPTHMVKISKKKMP